MTRLRQQMAVACPVTEAEARLEVYFEGLPSADGVARIRLRVPVGGSAAVLGLSLDREVRVEATRTCDQRHPNEVVRITWRPEGKAVFPQFEGTLAARAADESGSCYIALEGGYLPPFGVAGQVFDEVIGRRIAESTAREFLKDVKRAIESPPR